jgi:hypothetical protein
VTSCSRGSLRSEILCHDRPPSRVSKMPASLTRPPRASSPAPYRWSANSYTPTPTAPARSCFLMLSDRLSWFLMRFDNLSAPLALSAPFFSPRPGSASLAPTSAPSPAPSGFPPRVRLRLPLPISPCLRPSGAPSYALSCFLMLSDARSHSGLPPGRFQPPPRTSRRRSCPLAGAGPLWPTAATPGLPRRPGLVLGGDKGAPGRTTRGSNPAACQASPSAGPRPRAGSGRRTGRTAGSRG